jgi:hypothetical protein
MSRRRLLVAVVLALSLGLVGASSALATGISRVAVRQFLLRDPGVAKDIKSTIRQSSFGAGIDRLVYGDLTGDGQNDVAVTIFSGGTAGDIAFYVLSADGGTLHAIKRANDQYKIGLKIVLGRLQVTRPIYKGNDPNCCPSQLEITTYRYNGTRLVAASSYRDKTPTG